MDNETNQIIHEWLGKCWHISGWLPIGENARMADVRRSGLRFPRPVLSPRCLKCNDPVTAMSGESDESITVLGLPNYENDLNAVSIAEKKAVEVWGEVAVAIGLEKAVNEIEITKGVCTHDEVVFRAHFAPAAVRAAAVRKRIEESK